MTKIINKVFGLFIVIINIGLLYLAIYLKMIDFSKSFSLFQIIAFLSILMSTLGLLYIFGHFDL